MSLCLGQQACADLLGVSRRTVRYWDRGRSRVPWSAVRLLRVLRGGELPAPGWDGWTVRPGVLVTPAGVEFRASDFTWWALTCLQARSWQRAFDRQFRPSAGDSLPGALPVVDGGALDGVLRPELGNEAAVEVGKVHTLPPPSADSLLLAGVPTPFGVGESWLEADGAQRSALGLVSSYETKDTPDAGMASEQAIRAGDVGPQWGHNGATLGGSCDGEFEVQSAASGRSEGSSAGVGGARWPEPECSVCDGVAFACGLAEPEAPASAGCVDEPYDYRNKWPSPEGRRGSALPVRQRSEVQAVPR